MEILSSAVLRKALGDVRDSIQALDRTLSRLVTGNGTGKTEARPGRQPRRLSGKARAALVLQGRYMGYMRQLKPRQKDKVRAIRDSRGVRAAIIQAKKLTA
jgi:hypothetical protein